MMLTNLKFKVFITLNFLLLSFSCLGDVQRTSSKSSQSLQQNLGEGVFMMNPTLGGGLGGDDEENEGDGGGGESEQPPIIAGEEFTFYVDPKAVGDGSGTDWENAYRDLNLALRRVPNFSLTTIHIAEGTYFPTRLFNTDTLQEGSEAEEATFLLPPGVKLEGGYCRNNREQDFQKCPTILTAKLPRQKRANHILIFAPDSPLFLSALTLFERNIRLRGLTIQGGRADREQGYGGGLLVRPGRPELSTVLGATVRLNDLIFRDNRAHEGGALFAYNSSIRIFNCRFENNHALSGGGAIQLINFASPGIINSHFENNTAVDDGGAISFSGIQLGQGPFDIVNTIFHSNKALQGLGGAVKYASAGAGGATPLRVNNSLFTNNLAEKGGALWVAGGERRPSPNGIGSISLLPATVYMNNSTLSDNQASVSGNSIYLGNSEREDEGEVTYLQGDFSASNSIFWDSQIGLLSTHITGVGVFNASVISGLPDASYDTVLLGNFTNFDQDPNFNSCGENPYTPARNSFTREIGLLDFLTEDRFDLDADGDISEPIPYDLAGNPRLSSSGGLDLGALQFSHSGTRCTVSDGSSDAQGSL